jgi:hypothetical protein
MPTTLKSPEAVLRNALVANADVQALIAGRIYPLRYVGGPAIQFPLLLWRRARILRTPTLTGPGGMPRVTMELYVYATDYYTARDLADKCRRVLDGYAGSVENVEVRQATLEDEVDDIVEQEGAEVPIYSVRQTYDIFWVES